MRSGPFDACISILANFSRTPFAVGRTSGSRESMVRISDSRDIGPALQESHVSILSRFAWKVPSPERSSLSCVIEPFQCSRKICRRMHPKENISAAKVVCVRPSAVSGGQKTRDR
jgi:hypothetical protein